MLLNTQGVNDELEPIEKLFFNSVFNFIIRIKFLMKLFEYNLNNHLFEYNFQFLFFYEILLFECFNEIQINFK